MNLSDSVGRHCSLCGALGPGWLAGMSTYVCFSCIGLALASSAAAYGRPRDIHDFKRRLQIANAKCCLCALPAVNAGLVAIYDSWVICGDCLKTAAEFCIDNGEEGIGIVHFKPVEPAGSGKHWRQ